MDLAAKLKQALDETRMLMLGVQVLIGFQYQAFLQPAFDRMSPTGQWLMVAGLGLLLCTMACLFAPAMHHQIVEHGSVTSQALRVATRYATIALLPFAAALGLSFNATANELWGQPIGALVGAGAFATAMFFWYGLQLARRRRRVSSRTAPGDDEMQKRTPVKDRIDHVLTEARTVLPGAQAVLGFQFIAVLTTGFDALPTSSKYVHFGSLACIALSTILLLTPAAYHRIVEEGEDTEEFHRFASRALLAAAVPLALGLCGDVFVVVRKTSESVAISVGVAALVIAVCYGLWFGLTLVRRSAKIRRSPSLRVA